MDELDTRLHRIGQHHFRAKFRLRGRDRAVVDLRGITTVRRHAQELIGRRLAPAQPRNDGRQTPYRGHPVFVAQHATATCCRTCLARWHDIPTGHTLNDTEQGYVVEAICRWIAGQYAPTARRRDRIGVSPATSGCRACPSLMFAAETPTTSGSPLGETVRPSAPSEPNSPIAC